MKAMLLRFYRWLTACRHEWATTATNGFFLPIEERCIKCGEYRHRVVSAERLGMEAEPWQPGGHPKSPCAPLVSDEVWTDTAESVIEEIRWRCPACGCYRATLRKPEETEQQATNRLIDDHIKLGCAAYPPNAQPE